MTETSTLEQDFRRFADHPASVLEGALLVSRFIDPATDPAAIRRELLKLANKVGPAASAERLLSVLRQEGFAGAESYYEARNSSLGYVLAERCGIPISLAVVILGVAELLDLPAQGINFPGHFLVLLERQLVDPFTVQVIDTDARARLFAQAGMAPGTPLPTADARTLTLRMLNNLKGIALAAGDATRALECTDFQLLLAPIDPGLRLERAQLWLKLGVHGMAHRERDAALALCPDAGSRARLEAMFPSEILQRAAEESSSRPH